MAAPQEEVSLVSAKVNAEFTAIDDAARSGAPGILDLVQVYGNYAAAVQQASVYFGLIAPTVLPLSSSSNSSGH